MRETGERQIEIKIGRKEGGRSVWGRGKEIRKENHNLGQQNTSKKNND
jgi:hypothetical protein